MSTKRRLSADESALAVVPAAKRQRTDDGDEEAGAIITVERTSSLQAPIMMLAGHEAEVLATKFSPDGNVIASASMDKSVFLWRTYGECENFRVIKEHKNAVLDLAWANDGSYLFTASADGTACMFDVETGARRRRFKEHESYVNSCSPTRKGETMLATGSDDSACKMWDIRMKQSIDTFEYTCPITSVAYSDDGTQVLTGGLDNSVQVWDLRKAEIVYSLKGHTDTITSMSVSHDGSYLLTNAMDNSLRIWDIRAYAPPQRCVKILHGAEHNFERTLIKCAWSADDSRVTAGSSDQCVYIWDTTSRKVLYQLPGHVGTVNGVDFHPTEPIILSGGSDKLMYLGELVE